MNDFGNAFTFFFDHLSLIGEKTLSHLEVSFASVGVAILISIPLGVWLGHLHRFSFVAINVSNVGRALPSLAVISIGIGILGIGFVNVMVALVILAAPGDAHEHLRRRQRGRSRRGAGGSRDGHDAASGPVARRAADGDAADLRRASAPRPCTSSRPPRSPRSPAAAASATSSSTSRPTGRAGVIAGSLTITALAFLDRRRARAGRSASSPHRSI